MLAIRLHIVECPVFYSYHMIYFDVRSLSIFSEAKFCSRG